MAGKQADTQQRGMGLHPGSAAEYFALFPVCLGLSLAGLAGPLWLPPMNGSFFSPRPGPHGSADAASASWNRLEAGWIALVWIKSLSDDGSCWRVAFISVSLGQTGKGPQI